MPSERRAYICTHKEHSEGAKPVPNFRVFLAPGETIEEKACPLHGPRSMVRQENKRYLGAKVAK